MYYQNPYVSTSIKRIRKRLKGETGAEQFKENVKEAAQKGIDDFIFRLNAGLIKIDNVSDFEKLVKLGLLVHGEATEKIEHTTDIETIQEEKLNEIKESAEFEAIKQMLAEQLNKNNELGE